tara:strand:- start:9643 stop:10878 length:1236 start_codon:yes stop_codon:yes gene_type:complete
MRSFLQRLGPGLLYAGAAVGVSHLIQSTRAGADYGFYMVAVVLIANVIKYPFFKAAPIFVVKNGISLLEGFYRIGAWSIILFYTVTLLTLFSVQAVVTLITASILANVFQLSLPLWQISGAILLLCTLILLIGRFRFLNRLIKWVIVLLSVTSLVTLIAAIINYSTPEITENDFSFLNDTDVFFLIALVGWMPAPFDIAIFHSEWTLAEKEERKELSFKRSNFDFKMGYWGTTLLAMVFVLLGSLLLRGRGVELPDSGVAFAGEIIGMYTFALGSWAFVFVAVAALTTMFSTTLTILDAYPRVLSKAMVLSIPKLNGKQYFLYFMWLVLIIIGALFVLVFKMQNMKQMVDFATTISFLTAPILATLIYVAVRRFSPSIYSNFEKGLAILALIFLYCFSAYFLWISANTTNL